MRKPPSLTRLPAFPVTAGIGLMAAAVTGMILSNRWTIARFDMAPGAFRREPWRLVLSALPHVGVLHLGFNLYWLWVFGTLLEEVFGHVKLAALIVLFAVGSAAAEYALFNGGVGLSGVGYGLLGLTFVLARRDRRFVDAVDARTVQLFAAWFLICIATTITHVQPVANVAHAVGAILGLLVGAALTARTAAKRWLAGALVPALIGLAAVGASVLRPKVNLASHAGQGSAYAGFLALQDGHDEEAVKDYRDAVAMRGATWSEWFNLGVAYEGLKRWPEALDAFQHAHDLEPTEPKCRDALASLDRRLAYEAQIAGDFAEAIRLYRAALALDPADVIARTNLDLALKAAGQ